jgi:uncharacterized membrane protein
MCSLRCRGTDAGALTFTAGGEVQVGGGFAFEAGEKTLPPVIGENWAAAILFYLLFLAGLVVFVIAPAVEKGPWAGALLFGALFGLITYATYDLTNLATLKDWPLVLTVVDLTWGMVLAGSVSVGT